MTIPDPRSADGHALPTVLVTGSSGGLGRAVVRSLTVVGCRVCICYRGHRQAATELSEHLERTGGLVSVPPIDVCDAADTVRAVERVKSQWGSLDVLVNSVGVNIREDSLAASAEPVRTIFDVDRLGVYLTSQAGARQIAKQGSGWIIMLLLIAAEYALGRRAAYETSKAAVDRRVGSIPLLRTGLMDEISEAVHYLALDAADYITAAVIVVDGGRLTHWTV